jgi:mono/diheme cytochrome c family protein
MSKRPLVIFGIFAAICLVALPAWALTQKGSSDASPGGSVPPGERQGLQLFQVNCGACHTLAAAGTDGVVGPNLDELIGGTPASEEPSAEDKLAAYNTNYTRVLAAVTCGLEGRMPTGILQGADAQQVAGFVAAYAGQLGEDEGPLVPAAARPTPPFDQSCESG